MLANRTPFLRLGVAVADFATMLGFLRRTRVRMPYPRPQAKGDATNRFRMEVHPRPELALGPRRSIVDLEKVSDARSMTKSRAIRTVESFPNTQTIYRFDINNAPLLSKVSENSLLFRLQARRGKWCTPRLALSSSELRSSRRSLDRMKITQHSDFGFRILIYLASLPQERAIVRKSEISAAFKMSDNHVGKIVQQLAALGYIQALRGRNGGISLAHPPDQLRLGEIFLRLEPSLTMADCFAGGEGCIIESSCGLNIILHGALEAFVSHLNRYTLLDAIGAPDKTAQLLQIQPFPSH